LDDVDGVDLDVAEMSDRVRGGLRACAEWLAHIEPLRMQPDAPGLGLGQRMGLLHCGHRSAKSSRIRPPAATSGDEKPRRRSRQRGHMEKPVRPYFAMLSFWAFM